MEKKEGFTLLIIQLSAVAVFTVATNVSIIADIVMTALSFKLTFNMHFMKMSDQFIDLSS